MDVQKIIIVGKGADVSTICENCSPFDLVMLYMSSFQGLVLQGVIPPSLACAALNALSADL